MPLRVALIPNWRGNPYLDLLESSLRQHGIAVVAPGPPAPYVSWLRENQADIDVLHFHWPEAIYQGAPAGEARRRVSRLLPQLLMARSLGYRIVWTMHNLHSHELRYPTLDRIVWHIMARVSNAVIVHCGLARRVLRRRFWRAHGVHKVALGNYIGVHGQRLDRGSARHGLGIGHQETVFLSLGMVRPYKGLEDLIRTFSTLDCEDAMLHIAGRPVPPDYGQRLSRLAQHDERVRCDFGWIDDGDLTAYLGASDFVVLPYSGILTSSSVVLAMSYGRPVVVPRLGCLPEYVGNEAGILYNPEDAAGLAQALAQGTTMSQETIERMGRHGYQRAEGWTWAAVAEATARAYGGGA